MAQQVFLERYQIVRHIARGGMAEVYLAHDLLLDRPVALKVLFPEYASDRSFVERFRREARAAANLNHPNIVAIYDWGEEGGTYFIVMEYVEGRTLRDIIRADGPLHPIRAAEIGSDIAAAVAFAHQNDVIHRDLKPGNVLISGLVKVTDFGIARAGNAAESLTQTGAVMGTATYFSPEQAQGHDIDVRSDVYSLGVVLYEMVTGRPPFTGDNPVAIAYQHVRQEPVAPSRINPDVTPEFQAIIGKAMAKRKENRYGSADALRVDLLRFAQGQPVAAASGRPAAADGSAGAAAAVAPTGVIPQLGAGAGAGAGAAAAAGADGTAVMSRHTQVLQATDEEGRPPPRTSTYIIILAVLLALLAGMLFLLARTLGVGSTTEVSVPALIGKNQRDAEKALRDVGLKAKVLTRPDEVNQPGQVLEQNPNAGARVKKGSSVTMTVAGSPESIPVPNVVGKSQNEATDTLDNAGFKTSVTTKTDDKVPQGVVVSQAPRADDKAPKGSTVTITVSSGPEQVQVPSLFNQQEDDAAATLRALGLEVDRRTVADQSVAVGRVVRTDPAAGTPVAKGSTVTIIVSAGPPSTTTPPTTLPPTTAATLPPTTPPTTRPTTSSPPTT